jgi:transcriptional regulator with XRE-family HTH domain
MNLSDIGHIIQRRRKQVGLSQAQLATMGKLSRVTINQLENGSLSDLGAAKLFAIIDLLSIDIQAQGKHGSINAVQMLCQSASVSYKYTLSPQHLEAALKACSIPEDILPHISTLLDEAPESLIVKAVEELSFNTGLPAKKIWKTLAQFAEQLSSPRKMWT